MNATAPFATLAEKVVATYIQALVSILLVGEVADDVIDLSALDAAAVAAIPAALTVVANGLPTVAPNLPFWVDLVLRTVRTYVVSFIGLLVAAPTFDLDLSLAAAAATGAVPAALAVIKAGVGSLVGDANSAALLPRRLDATAR